jgi:phosphoserine phosphatase RsbU/P
MNRRVLQSVSIRFSVPVLFALPVLLVAGVLIAIAVVQGRAAVTRLASQQLAQIHGQIGQHIESLVSLPVRVNRSNAVLIENGLLDLSDLRAWRPLLIEQFLGFEVLSAIVWGGEDGRCTWVARYGGDDQHVYYTILDQQTGGEMVEYRVDRDGRTEAEPVRAYAFDPRTRPWYAAPRNAGTATWSEPFLWVGGDDQQQPTLGIAHGEPLYDDAGELIGVIDAELSLQDISRYLATLRIGRSGRAYLADDRGMLLASSTGAAVAGGAGERLHARESEQTWISASALHVERIFGSVGSVDRDHEEIVTIASRRERLFASDFVHESGLRWVIVTLVPESDFTAEIAAGRRRSTWFALGAVLGTIGLGVLLASAAVRPILELSRHVRGIGEGQLEGAIHLPYARELVRLSEDINRMTADLRDRMALRRSLAMAMEVQQSLLPSEVPKIEGLDIAGHSTYCDETGGDYYDYLDIADLSSDTAALGM